MYIKDKIYENSFKVLNTPQTADGHLYILNIVQPSKMVITTLLKYF